MINLPTYLIYIFLLIYTVFGTYLIGPKRTDPRVVERNNLNIAYLFIVLVISFIVGFRHEVGVDWEAYIELFKHINSLTDVSTFSKNTEWGYFWINRVIGQLGLGYVWMFFTIGLITWYFYFKSVPKVLIPLFIYFIFVDGQFFFGMNGVRQFVAMAIWLFSLKYLVSKDFKRYLLLILFASLFHLSALLLIPLYFFPYEKFYNQYIWISVYLISLVFIFFIDLSALYTYIGIATLFLSQYIEAFEGYARYVELGKLAEKQIQLGLGFIFRLLVNGFIIWVSIDIVKYKPKLKPHFILFFVGTIIFNLFFDVQLITRINTYLIILKPVLLAYIVYFYWHIKPKRLMVITLVSLYFLFFISIIYNGANMCCPYQFSF